MWFSAPTTGQLLFPWVLFVLALLGLVFAIGSGWISWPVFILSTGLAFVIAGFLWFLAWTFGG